MFGFFERLVNPFPPESPQLPPRGIYAFCRYYIRGIEHWLVLMGVLTAITAVSEAMLFSPHRKLKSPNMAACRPVMSGKPNGRLPTCYVGQTVALFLTVLSQESW